jgi:glycosyltransferase involved in cell wall biosynthesis
MFRSQTVAMFAPEGGVSGAEKVLLSLLGGRLVDEFDVTVGCPAGSQLDRRLHDVGLRTTNFTLDKISEAGKVAFARQLGLSSVQAYRMARRGKGILHAFIPQAVKTVAPIALMTRRPMVVSVHSVLSAAAIGRANAFVDRRLTNLGAQRVIAVSNFIRHSLEDSGYPHNRIVTVHNGVDINEFAVGVEAARALRLAHFPDDSAVVFGVIGRLTGWKGQDLAIRALREVLRERPDCNAYLLIVGSSFHKADTEYASSLAPLAQKLGVLNRVVFLPNMEKVEEAYAACDVVMVPSTKPDPFPTVVLEASASARPVLATSLGGAAEAIVEGETGFVLQPTVDSFAAGMRRMLEQCDVRAMGCKARSYMNAHFSLDSYRSGVIDVWRDVVSGDR